MHYNLFSRLHVDLVNRYIGIPLVGYFDDFAATITSTIGQDAIDSFARFCPLVGFQLKEEKSEVEPSVVFRGHPGSSPCAADGGQLMISLGLAKRSEWSGGSDFSLMSGKADRSLISAAYATFLEIWPLADATDESEIPSHG